MAQRISRRALLSYVGLASSAVVLAACQPKVVERIVKETVVVTEDKIVKEVVELEKEVTRVVEKEKIVESAVKVPEEPVEIIFMERNFAQDIAFRTELAERFTKENPDIKVTVQTTPDDFRQTLMARLAAGTAGDMWRSNVQAGLGQWAGRGLIWGIDEFVDADNYDLTPFIEQGIESCKFKGNLCTIPVNGHSGLSGLYHDVRAYEEAGVDPPSADWTYDDLIEASVKLTKDSDGDGRIDQWGLWIHRSFEAWMTPIRAHGGWPLDDTNTKARWTDPATMAGIQMWFDMIYKYRCSTEGIESRDRYTAWNSKKIRALMSGLWEGAYLRDVTSEDVDLKLVPGPKGPAGLRAGSMGVNFFMTWRASKHPRECWEFNKYICTKEVGIENIERIGEPGLRHDVWESPEMRAFPLTYPHYELLKEAKRFPAPANGRESEFLEVVGPLLQAIFINELGPEEGCEMLQEQTQEVLDMSEVSPRM